MAKKVLVTGGAGYIGSHTVVELVKSGYDPVILDDYRNSNASVIKRLTQIIGKEPEHVVCDVCDQNRIEEIVDTYSISGVIHFAAYKAVGESVENPLKYYSNNIAGLVSVLNVLKKRPETPFVFSSSCTVYGEPMGLKEVNENTAKSIPTSPYGYTKWLGEQIIDDLFNSNKQLKMMSLRYFNPIGAHETAKIGELPLGVPQNLIPFVVQTAAGIRECLSVFGNDYNTPDGTAVRDYIHVVDLAKAHIVALNRLLNIENKAACEFFNVGTGKGSSVLDVINAFEKATNKKVNYKIVARRAGDITAAYADTSLANNELGWKAELGLEQALASSWKWQESLK